jgi:ubiquinone/menaquinone biosynthesis C-methylase UbiE
MSKISESARKHAQMQWDNTPCGEVDGNKDTLEYFEEVEKERYRQQYWQLKYFDFGGFRGKNVLEIGVGHGTDIHQFAKGGAICHAIDITDSHINLAKRNFELRGYKIEIKKSDATHISYPDNYFDCVYSFGVLHHIPEIDQCISEISRVLKPGGVLYIALYHKYSLATLLLIIYNGIYKGKLFKLGYKGLLSLIEKGADGIHIKPYVRLYSKFSTRKVLKNKFEIEDISVHQIHFEKLKFLNKLRFLDNFFGWYVVTKSINKK